MITIRRALYDLAFKRPIFHSEADFQHALAWELHLQSPTCSVRLEYKPPHFGKRAYVDIWAKHNEAVLAIELKYKTRSLNVWIKDEAFFLLDQSAQDIARYDFLKDIYRLEQIVSSMNHVMGYAIFLTNDSAYWKPPRSKKTVDANFRIHEGRYLTGDLCWGTAASSGTTSGREKAIPIREGYDLHWQDYSQPSKASYGKYKYLLVEVPKK